MALVKYYFKAVRICYYLSYAWCCCTTFLDVYTCIICAVSSYSLAIQHPVRLIIAYYMYIPPL